MIFSVFEPLPDANMAIFSFLITFKMLKTLLNKPIARVLLAIDKLHIFTHYRKLKLKYIYYVRNYKVKQLLSIN